MRTTLRSSTSVRHATAETMVTWFTAAVSFRVGGGGVRGRGIGRVSELRYVFFCFEGQHVEKRLQTKRLWPTEGLELAGLCSPILMFFVISFWRPAGLIYGFVRLSTSPSPVSSIEQALMFAGLPEAHVFVCRIQVVVRPSFFSWGPPLFCVKRARFRRRFSSMCRVERVLKLLGFDAYERMVA